MTKSPSHFDCRFPSLEGSTMRIFPQLDIAVQGEGGILLTRILR